MTEAAVNRTYIVATSIAVEFLDHSTRELITVPDSPEEMAASIVSLLRDPSACESRLSALHERISQTFTWSQRTRELAQIARTA